eukprot:scaffold13962_cov74-Phaeocystis_antarctica.AAC.2
MVSGVRRSTACVTSVASRREETGSPRTNPAAAVPARMRTGTPASDRAIAACRATAPPSSSRNSASAWRRRGRLVVVRRVEQERRHELPEHVRLERLERDEHAEQLGRLVLHLQVERAEERHRRDRALAVDVRQRLALRVDSVKVMRAGHRRHERAQPGGGEALRDGVLAAQQLQQAVVRPSAEGGVAAAQRHQQVSRLLEVALGMHCLHEYLQPQRPLRLADDLLEVTPGGGHAVQQHDRLVVVLGRQLLEREDLDDGSDATHLHKLGEEALARRGGHKNGDGPELQRDRAIQGVAQPEPRCDARKE